ncbi:class I SAM-dependent methyltransferase [Orenia marismortui]|uniref:class I SAM-dependent methyltransferase n=1 Tax=Orenia marismortui TaxID=46469 RepID=UPI00035F1726|nr:class I SAM-dependent methyltransferase [Orenia marismortui]
MKQNKSKVLKIKDYIENEIISIKDQESDLNTKENKDLLNFKLQQLESNIDQNNNNWDVNSQQDITSHRKIIGKFIVFSKKIIRKLLSWYINPIVGQQKSFNGSVTRTLNELYKFTKGIIPNINSNYNEINMLKGQINCLTQSIEEIRSRENKFRSEIDQTKIEINDLKEGINDLELEIVNSREKIYEVEAEINNMEERVYERIENLTKKSNDRENTIKEIINEIEMKVNSSKEEVYERIENLTKKSNDRENTIKEIINEIEIKVNSSKEEIYERIENLAKKSNDRENTIKEIEKNITNINNETQDKSEAIDFDYLEFENKFRGSEELIKNRMKKYFNYFREKSNVLDIGCGRGEFLELLQKGNVNSKGIDINKQMVEHCQNKGLDVVRSDAIEYLEQVEDGSLDGVFMGQVVEHLDLNYLLKVIELIDKKLTENGIFIAETPNPQSIYIYANAFYIDPTHVKPVHPATLKYLIERYSLEVMEVQGASAIPEENKLLTIHDEYLKNDNLEKLNSNWDKLNNLLFNYRDYAIVAKKLEVV